MFVFTYLPQAAFLALVNGPWAAVTTIVLVMNESATILNALSRAFILDDALVDTFDVVIIPFPSCLKLRGLFSAS